MRIRFLRDFRWRVPERNGRVALVYRAGTIHLVRRICGEAAIAAGAAEFVTRTERAHAGG